METTPSAARAAGAPELVPAAPVTAGKLGDAIFHVVAWLCAVIVVAVMGGIFIQLAIASWPTLRLSGLGFLWSSEWNPVTEKFGAASSVFGTLASTLIAMTLAVPMSMAIAVFLVDLAKPSIAKPVGYAIELLASVPSIIFGMWGLFVFAPFMSKYVQPALTGVFGFLPLFQGPPIGIGILAAGIILALMILPFMTAVMRDVLFLVPQVLKEAAYGMGSTTWEVNRYVTVPFAIRGMVGACFLGLARALGETMAVTFVIGNNNDISWSLYASGNTIPSKLANEFAEASDTLHLSALMELGLVLFLVTFIVQLLAQLWLKRLGKASGQR
jgi:phosphate transport system permease protein